MRRRRRQEPPTTSPTTPDAGAAPVCQLCERAVGDVSRHHLVPREEGGRYGPTVALCQPCHSTVHLMFSNKELARRFPSVEQLRTAEELQKYLHWIRRSRVERIRNRRRH